MSYANMAIGATGGVFSKMDDANKGIREVESLFSSVESVQRYAALAHDLAKHYPSDKHIQNADNLARETASDANYVAEGILDMTRRLLKKIELKMDRLR